MYFKPKTDEELQAQRHNQPERPKILPGVVDFEVITAELKEKGMKVNMKIYDANGNYGYLNDFLPKTEKAIWKVKQFCDATGLEHEYYEGHLEPYMLYNKRGRCVVFYENDEKYGEQLRVKTYFLIDKKEVGSKPSMVKPQSNSPVASTFAPFEADDVPF